MNDKSKDGTSVSQLKRLGQEYSAKENSNSKVELCCVVLFYQITLSNQRFTVALCK